MTPVELRRSLHRHPELSFGEVQTARTISEALRSAGFTPQPIAGTGVLVRLTGRGDTRRAVVLRADIDALPVQEDTGLEYASQSPGVMHACGHDLHAAALYGALLALRDASFEGTIFGLFQPGEEVNPGGAAKVLAEDPFTGYEVVAVLGEHVEPQLTVGTLGFRAGKYMAANDELRFRVRGRGGHAAQRAQCDDTVRAAADLVLRLTDLNTPERVVSIGRVEAPGATNVIPDEVYMEGTMRTFDEGDRTRLKEQIAAIACAIDAAHGVVTAVDLSPGYPCVVNNPALTETAVELARTEGIPYEMLALRTTAEDFGHYGQRYPSLFYRLGVGGAAGRLHTARFNPDERALEVGARFLSQLALKCLDR